MPLYEIADGALKPHPIAEFAALGLYERADLQRMLRDDILPLGDDLLVIAEEFGEWEDARRRIDLLALDKGGRLVVIELKRTHDGGHMELQAIRYAAMVSSMGFPEVAAAYARHWAKFRPDEEIDARAALVTFLKVADDEEEPAISTDVRIILVSADFGREITTTVLWLNRFPGMDIRCVRLIPYSFDGKVLLDIQQVLPLPEAADYQIQLRRKDAAIERARTRGQDYTRYHIVVDNMELPEENKRNAIRVMVEQLAARGVPLDEISKALPDGPARRMRVLAGRFVGVDAVREAMLAADPKVDVRRWFCDHPYVDEDAGLTYVLINQWGTNTEPTLEALAEAFPHAKITYRRADPLASND
jgi:hypothetical protein